MLGPSWADSPLLFVQVTIVSSREIDWKSILFELAQQQLLRGNLLKDIEDVPLLWGDCFIIFVVSSSGTESEEINETEKRKKKNISYSI